MAKRFDVTTEELINSANKINGLLNEWISEVNSIYAAVEELRLTYQGEASNKFAEKLNEYGNDFQQAREALVAYNQFLVQYAKDVQHVEDDLKNQASNLSIGK